MNYTAHIWLTESGQWQYPILQVQTEKEAQDTAEAIALCHGANVKNPHTVVFAVRKAA